MQRGRAFWIGLLALALSATGPVRVHAAECDQIDAKVAKLDAAIAKLDKTELPRRLATNLISVLDELIDGLKRTNGDLNKITGAVGKAKAKLADITKALKESRVALPPGWGQLSGAVDSLAQGLESGVKSYEASAPGQTAAGLSKAQGYIGRAVDQLQSVRDRVAALQALDRANNDSAADQVRALQVVIDQTRDFTGAGKVPGVGQFLEAYSRAVGGIANNVASIEGSMKANVAMAETALKGTDFESTEIYMHAKSEAEKQAAALEALRKERADLLGKRAALDCNKPPPPPDPCFSRKLGTNGNTPADTVALIRKMMAAPGSAYSRVQSAMAQDDALAGDAYNDAMHHAMGRPAARPGETATAYRVRLAPWRKKQDQLDAEYEKWVAARAADQAKLDAILGNAIAQEASAKNWSAGDKKLFDECYRDEGALRREAEATHSPRPRSGGQDKRCARGGGLIGGVNYVTCQMGH